MDKKLKGNVAIVTGAPRASGSQSPSGSRVNGAKLVLADLDAAGLKQAETHLNREFGAEVASQAGDLSEQAPPKKTIDLATGRFGRLDILVNNAGGGIIKAFAEHSRKR